MAVDSRMKISVSRVHFPVLTLGPGRRLGIWLQGCTLACSGCVSRDTWVADARHETTVMALLERCDELAPGSIDGITISGGEPFEQPEALRALLLGLARRRHSQTGPLDVLVYSGFRLATLQRRFGDIIALTDAIVSEPFDEAKGPGDCLRGSDNQQITTFSPLGETLYGEPIEAHLRSVQIAEDAGAIWFIGIPAPGDMERLTAAARLRGVELEACSWRA